MTAHGDMVGETHTQQVNSPAGSSLATYTQNFPNVETSDSVIPFLELWPGK